MPPTIRTNSGLHLQQIVNAMYRRIVAASAPPSLVWRPGDTSRTPGVYGTFAAITAAASKVPGYKVVYLDDSLATCSVPAGVWDLGGYTVMQGRQRGLSDNMCRCIFDNGARVVNVFEFQMLEVESRSSEPAIRTSDLPVSMGTAVYRVGMGTKMSASDAAPLFVTDGGPPTADWWLTEDSRFVSSKSPVLLAQGRSTVIIVYASDRSTIEKDTLSSLPNASISCEYASVEADIAKDQFGSPIPTRGIRIVEGNGDPNKVVVGVPGDMYVDRMGGRALYVKESGIETDTGWSPK